VKEAQAPCSLEFSTPTFTSNVWLGSICFCTVADGFAQLSALEGLRLWRWQRTRYLIIDLCFQCGDLVISRPCSA